MKNHLRCPQSGRALVALLLPFACSLLPCAANDSAFSGVSGTPKPMKGEHPTVVMQSEKIVITANDKTYDTRVDFVFRNDGAATTVQMGFPENSFGDIKAEKKSAFLRFATFVDNRKVAATRRKISGDDSPEVEAYWLKTVRFGPRQTRKIRVSYTSPMGGTTEWGRRDALAYDFTGQNWKGKVERSDLEVRITQPGLWIGMPSWNNSELAMTLESKPSGAVFRKTWRDWQAQGSFQFGLTRAVPFWMQNRDSLQVAPEIVAKSQTFRIGAVPDALPIGADAPDAFTRGGVTYISLSHLKSRLERFAFDLERHRGRKVAVDLVFDEKTRVSRLKAGQTTLLFRPDSDRFQLELAAPAERPSDLDLRAPTILLQTRYGAALFVPLMPVVDALGLRAKITPGSRLFELHRGAWEGR